MINAKLQRMYRCFPVISDYWSNCAFDSEYLSLTYSFGVNP